MKRQALYFTGPGQVNIQEEDLPALRSGEVLVRSIASAISPGTELLIYRDQAPKGQAADATIEALEGELNYPFKYGYATVGEIIELGPDVEAQWFGKRVFAFNPHESLFNTQIRHLHAVPATLSTEDAIFLPNMETAINFVMDGKPMIGERVAVFGQGIVGLLTTSLLSRFPLAELITVDKYENRREASLSLGATDSIHPEALSDLQRAWPEESAQGADLIYELSSAPDTLNHAIRLAGFEGRIIIGSWYGDQQTTLELGREFHRNRVKLVSSQVSTLAADLRSRWSKARRFELAWGKLGEIKPSRFITHRFPLEHAAEAYRLLDQKPEEAIQIIFQYQ